MKENWTKPEFKKKLYDYLLSDRNPIRDPKIQRRSLLKQAAKGWPNLIGGNGKGPTLPQEILFAALGDGWKMEYSVKRYKFDLANPGLLIAIEVDGHSHKAQKVRAADRRKAAAARRQGWTVLHFWNWDILDSLDKVLRKVKRFTT